MESHSTSGGRPSCQHVGRHQVLRSEPLLFATTRVSSIYASPFAKRQISNFALSAWGRRRQEAPCSIPDAGPRTKNGVDKARNLISKLMQKGQLGRLSQMRVDDVIANCGQCRNDDCPIKQGIEELQKTRSANFD